MCEVIVAILGFLGLDEKFIFVTSSLSLLSALLGERGINNSKLQFPFLFFKLHLIAIKIVEAKIVDAKSFDNDSVDCKIVDSKIVHAKSVDAKKYRC